MKLAASGKIDTASIASALAFLNKDFKTTSLPICVDFDHVFDVETPMRCFARSNIEDLMEGLFYITEPSQAILNQIEMGFFGNGRFMTLLPCKSWAIEDSTHYANNLFLTIFTIGLEDKSFMRSRIEKIYAGLGMPFIVETLHGNVVFKVKGITVCVISTIMVGDVPVTLADVIVEPLLSYVRTL